MWPFNRLAPEAKPLRSAQSRMQMREKVRLAKLRRARLQLVIGLLKTHDAEVDRANETVNRLMTAEEEQCMFRDALRDLVITLSEEDACAVLYFLLTMQGHRFAEALDGLR